MNRPNLAFSGSIGSGKTSVSKLIASALGYGWNGFGSTVKRIAAERSIPIKREALQFLGADLIAKAPEAFCTRVVDEARQAKDTPVVIDGLRHAHIRDLLRGLSAPRKLLCIYVDVADDIRFKRLAERDGLSALEIQTIEGHSTEIEVNKDVRRFADFVVANNNELPQTVHAILAWLDAASG
jgi:dephospho-CoA kinase